MKMTAVVAMLVCALSANAATKAFIQVVNTNYPSNQYTFIDFYDTTTMSFISNKLVFLPKDNSILTSNDMIAYVKAAAYTEAGVKGYTITDADIISSFPLNGFPTPSFAYPSRTLGTAFQISTSRNARVSYAVQIAATLSLTTGQSGIVILEYADDSGFTTNVVTVQSGINANTGSLALGLNLTQTVMVTLSGDVPAAKYVRVRTVSNTGTPSFTWVNSQEVLYN
jgi:hypothetical protein